MSKGRFWLMRAVWAPYAWDACDFLTLSTLCIIFVNLATLARIEHC